MLALVTVDVRVGYAAVTNNSKSQQLNTVEVYFLFMSQSQGVGRELCSTKSLRFPAFFIL